MLFTQASYTDATTSFYKALAIDNKHVPSLVHLARVYMETDDIEMAEGILDSVTKSNGWNCAEAWYVFFIYIICELDFLNKYIYEYSFIIIGSVLVKYVKRLIELKDQRIVCGMHWIWKKPNLLDHLTFYLNVYNYLNNFFF